MIVELSESEVKKIKKYIIKRKISSIQGHWSVLELISKLTKQVRCPLLFYGQ